MSPEVRAAIARLDVDDETTLALAKEHAENGDCMLEMQLAELSERLDALEAQLGDTGEAPISAQLRFLGEIASRIESAVHILRFRLGVHEVLPRRPPKP